MEIQTFEIEETVGGTTPEVEKEAIDLIKSLGLEGQESLLIKKDEVAVERFQYPEMTKQEIEVYKAVFPQQTKIEDYDAGIIPVRVMQVVAHAREHCDFLQVWHKKVRDPDPLLVGVTGSDPVYGVEKRFLLARWGDALKDFSETIVEAREALRVSMKLALEEKIRVGQASLAQLDSLVEKKLAGDYVDF